MFTLTHLQAHACEQLTRVRPRFVFTRVFGICQFEQSWVEPYIVLTRVEHGLVCAMETLNRAFSRQYIELKSTDL